MLLLQKMQPGAKIEAAFESSELKEAVRRL
jgi:hypothetical protein